MLTRREFLRMEKTNKPNKRKRPWFQGWLLRLSLVISMVSFNVSGQTIESFHRIGGGSVNEFGWASAGVYGDINADDVNDMVVGAASEGI